MSDKIIDTRNFSSFQKWVVAATNEEQFIAETDDVVARAVANADMEDEQPTSLNAELKTVDGLTFLNVDFGDMDLSGFEFGECKFVNCSMNGVNFTDAEFSLCSFKNCQGNEMIFDGAKIDGVAMSNCELNGDFNRAIFDGVRCDNVEFRDSFFVEAKFIGASCFANCNFHGAEVEKVVAIDSYFKACCIKDVSGWEMSNCILSMCDFSESHLSDLKLSKSQFQACNFNDVIISNSSFSQTKFQYCDLTKALIRQVSFKWSDVVGCNFSYGTFDGSDLVHTAFEDVIFEYGSVAKSTIRDKSNFKNVDFRGTVFYGTSLKDSQIISSNLFGAKLSRAELHNVKIERTDLSEANVEGLDLGQVEFSSGVFDESLFYSVSGMQGLETCIPSASFVDYMEASGEISRSDIEVLRSRLEAQGDLPKPR